MEIIGSINIIFPPISYQKIPLENGTFNVRKYMKVLKMLTSVKDLGNTYLNAPSQCNYNDNAIKLYLMQTSIKLKHDQAH